MGRRRNGVPGYGTNVYRRLPALWILDVRPGRDGVVSGRDPGQGQCGRYRCFGYRPGDQFRGDPEFGETIYPLLQITGLVFQVEGYDGMADPEGYAPNLPYSRTRRPIERDEQLSQFQNGEEKMEWQFYLPDPQHVQQLGVCSRSFTPGVFRLWSEV